MEYLGLGSDDAYDDYEGYPEREPSGRVARPAREYEARAGRPPQPEYEPDPTVRAVPARPSFPSRDFDASGGRRNPMTPPPDDSGVQARPQRGGSSMRTITPVPSTEPHTVRPRRFDQAQEVADKFKDGMPVIMNLEGCEREIARRLIDFASGICYALDGSMEKVASGVYLLKPPQQRPRYDDFNG
jgi:cell division inhibitor SepF